MLKFAERPKTPGSLKKNMAFPEGNKLFADNFRANLDETNAKVPDVSDPNQNVETT